MDIANTVTASQTAVQPTTSETTSEPAINSDFETFLQMLTAQLENQDPLNPLESQDFAVQLATFSSVEQQTLTNTLLEDMSRSLGTSGLAEMSQWIGREAQVTGALPYSGTPLELTFTLPAGALTSELVVTDATGHEVARHAVTAQDQAGYLWTGVTPGGTELRQGTYSFHVENTVAEGTLPASAVSSYVLVKEARTAPTGQTLLLEGGLEVAPGDISAIRNPST